ncbi:MAG: hypothetical protein AAFW46_18770, partial [Pseudomonadota bacterium]
MAAANASALAFWRAEDVAALSARRFFAEEPMVAELAALAPRIDRFGLVRTVIQIAGRDGVASIAAELSPAALPDGRRGVRVCHLGAPPDIVRGHLLLEHAPLAIAAFDVDGRAQFRNRADLLLFADDADTLESRFSSNAAAAEMRGAARRSGVAHAELELLGRFGPERRRLTLRRIGRPTDPGEPLAEELLAYVEDAAPYAPVDEIPSEASNQPADARTTPEPADAPAPSPSSGRVARLAESALDAAPLGLALFAGEGWELYYANPMLSEWLDGALPPG